MMVAEVDARPESVTDLLVDFIDTRVAQGVPLDEAVERASEWLRSEQMVEQFFDEHPESIIRDVWRARQQARRRSALSHGSRRNKTNPLAEEALSAYDALFQVPSGGWKRLGDFDSQDCLLVADAYRKSAGESVAQAEFFESVQRRLEGGQQVSEVYSEAELRLMFGQAQA